ncbi:MAG TPA: DUF5709 domain-containing protein [Mycobacterium sp.]|nr:DUF5709 domain-containing protein [Mycobacterium sp.]
MSEFFGDSVYESGDAVDDADVLDSPEGLLGGDPDEQAQTGYSPPEREPYNFRHAPTAFDDAQGESLDERLAEEEPDAGEDDLLRADEQARTGRLVRPDRGSGVDEEADEIAEDVGTAGYAASAEEAAVHLTDPPD